MTKITDENLQILIEGLTEYKDDGIENPWVLSNGEVIEPLDVLFELEKLRGKQYPTHQPNGQPVTEAGITFSDYSGHWFCTKRLADMICCDCTPHKNCYEKIP